MYRWILLITGALFIVTEVNGQLTGPNVCTTTILRYTSVRICAYRTWRACCSYIWIVQCLYVRTRDCCRGYLANSNTCQPVCFRRTGRAGCNGNGNCLSPNNCDCDAGYKGPQCNGKVACSVTKPCYPGDCPSADQCRCSEGFQATSNCTTITVTPTMTRAFAVLAYVHPQKNMDIYNFTTDAVIGGNLQSQGKQIWANFRQFNSIRTGIGGILQLPNGVATEPDYIRGSKFGIVKAEVKWTLQKIDVNDGKLKQFDSRTKSCPSVSQSKPNDTTFECDFKNISNPFASDSGDILTLEFMLTSGGYANLNNGGQIKYRSNGRSTAKVEYRIDLDKPKAASAASCLVMEKSFTKEQISVNWKGWTDRLSQMARYNVEVFELRNEGSTLRYVERDKCIAPQDSDKCNQFLDPITNMEYNHTDSSETKHFRYTPPKIGVYAVILEASDNANNSEYVVRYVVYDNTSSIELQSGENNIRALSGVAASGYRWQALTSSTQTNVAINISWENHFINSKHNTLGFLNQIEEYPPQLADMNVDPNIFPKTINARLNANKSAPQNRPRESIPNKLGIIRFEYFLDKTGGEQMINNFPWTNAALQTSMTSFLTSVKEGDFVKLWVRAHDAMGNEKVSGFDLGFDSSVPQLFGIQFKANVRAQFMYGSTIQLKATDRQSGISLIRYTIFNRSNNSVAYNGTLEPKPSITPVGNPDEYYSVRDVYYTHLHEIEVNNCVFRVPKERQSTDKFDLRLEVYNGAMMLNRSSTEINHFGLKGIGEYQPPRNVTVLDLRPTGARFGWNLTESCYRRTKIKLQYRDTDGILHNKTTDTNAHRFDLLGLRPLTRYNVSFVIEYDGVDLSNAAVVAIFTPAELEASSQIGAAGISGIAVAVSILLLFIIFVLIMYKTGRLRKVQTVVVAPIQQSIRRRRDGAGAMGYKQYNTGGYEQEDIYMYGGITFEKSPDWHYKMQDLTIDTLLKTGRFAMIYKATLYQKGKPKEVVAKTLKDGYTDDDKVLMKAKINFFGTKVEEHPCVLGFIGAITEEQSMGPIMLLEYCENGTLKDWLMDQKGKVSDDTIENLFRFSYDITRGMMHLASKEIIHMRLATRNIYLNRSMSAKIAGFGPRQGDEEDESGRKERIPVKWMAPECLNKTGAASEKSDVWSYGVTIWEIFTIGDSPYENVRSRDLPKWIKQGNRLHKPEYCDDLHYEIMNNCWSYRPSERPTFSDINRKIESLFRQSSGDLYYYDGGK